VPFVEELVEKELDLLVGETDDLNGFLVVSYLAAGHGIHVVH